MYTRVHHAVACRAHCGLLNAACCLAIDLNSILSYLPTLGFERSKAVQQGGYEDGI
jgi:hypothetical protein